MEANTLDVELARVLCLTHIRAPWCSERCGWDVATRGGYGSKIMANVAFVGLVGDFFTDSTMLNHHFSPPFVFFICFKHLKQI